MTALNAMLVLACAVVFTPELSSILPVGRLRRANPLVWLFFFFFQLELVRKLPEACRSVHRTSFSRSARCCTQIA